MDSMQRARSMAAADQSAPACCMHAYDEVGGDLPAACMHARANVDIAILVGAQTTRLAWLPYGCVVHRATFSQRLNPHLLCQLHAAGLLLSHKDLRGRQVLLKDLDLLSGGGLQHQPARNAALAAVSGFVGNCWLCVVLLVHSGAEGLPPIALACPQDLPTPKPCPATRP